jgi:hypothetical protein
MWFSGNASAGKCPDGEGHSDKGSGEYSLELDGNGQADWRWCKKCQGLWFAGKENGKCPAGGGHVKDDSGNYTLASE